MKTAREIFEAYINSDCADYLYSLRADTFEAASEGEPSINRWNIYEHEDKEYSEDDLDIVKEYLKAFEALKSESELLIKDLCFERVNNKSLYDLLEDVYYDYIPTDIYNCFHNLITLIDKDYYTKQELQNLYNLANSKDPKNKDTFLAMITPL